MAEAGIQEFETYVAHHQKIVAKYIVTVNIMDLCLAAERRQGTRDPKRWQEQNCLVFGVMRTAFRVEEMGESEGEESGEEMDE